MQTNKNATSSTNGHLKDDLIKEGVFTSVPVLDYAESASPSTRPAFLKALKAAIVNVGFFYLKNTGVPDKVQSDFTDQSIALFNLPLEKKLEIEMVNSKHFLGYARLGQEVTALKNDYREQFDVRLPTLIFSILTNRRICSLQLNYLLLVQRSHFTATSADPTRYVCLDFLHDTQSDLCSGPIRKPCHSSVLR